MRITLDSSRCDSAEHIFWYWAWQLPLIAFILPEIKHRLEKKAHNYIQQRFSNNGVTVLTVLAFLKEFVVVTGLGIILLYHIFAVKDFRKIHFTFGPKYSAGGDSTL